MHPILLIGEIVDIILDFVEVEDLPQVSLTCKALRYAVKIALLRRQQTLRDLVDFLPTGLVCPGRPKSLLVYLNDTPDESRFPLALSAVLPKYHRIRGEFVPQAGDAHLPLEPTPPITSVGAEQNINFMNWPAHLAPLRSPAPSSTNQALPTPFQFVKIFQREPTEEDIIVFARRTQRCSRLVYSTQDHEAFLVIHALERLFPSIDFFPVLSDIVITSSSADEDPPSQSSGVYVPFSLMRRVNSLTIDDGHVAIQSSSVPYRWELSRKRVTQCLRDLPQECLGSISTVTYAAHQRPDHRPDRFAHPIVIMPGSTPALTVPASPDIPVAETDITALYIEIPTHFEDFLCTLRHKLRTLKLSATPESTTWRGLSRFRALEELELGQTEGGAHIGKDGEGMWNRKFVTMPVILPQLRKFTCRRHAISARLPEIFEFADFPSLTDLIIEAPQKEADVVFIGDALGFIGERTPQLRHLSVDARLPDVAIDQSLGVLLSAAAIENLVITATRLEYLHISCSPNTIIDRIDNDSVRKMTTAWPHITHLYLDPLHSPSSAVTLEGLIPIARSFPHLDTLGVGLDVQAMHVVYSSAMYLTELNENSASPLKHLDVGAPWALDTALCAEFLRTIFPALIYLRVPSADEYHSPSAGRIFAWSNVARLVEGANNVIAGTLTHSESVPAISVNVDDDEADYYYDSGADGEGSDDFSE